MSREAVDETLAGLGAAHDRIAAAMFAIDSHPGLAYLRGGGVAGLTETRWATLRPEVDRGDKGAPLSAALAEAAKTDLGDPLSAAPGGRLARATQARLDRLTTQLGVLRERVGALVGIWDGYPRRMAELRALVDQVGAAEGRLAEGYARVADRIADTGLPPAPHAAAVLQARLADLDRLHREQRWVQLADDAAALQRAATRARQRADELRDAADGLLARRDELRGRLEAYRAKA